MPDFAVSAIIGAKGVQFLNTFRAMKGALSSFGTSAKSAFERAIPGGRALSGLLHSMAGQVAIGNLLSRGITAIGHELAQLPQQLEDFAARGQEIGRTALIVGTTAEAFQRLSYTAKLTDTPIDTLQSSMMRLNKNMAELTVGKGTLKDLAMYGPKGLAKMIRGTHDTTEAMMLLADAFKKTHDPQVRARMAVAAFGKAGQEMIPFLLEGREGLEKLMKEADKYGSVLSNDVVKASGYFEDTLKRTRGTISAIKDSMYGYVMIALTPYLEKARDWLANNRELIKQKIPEYIDKITSAAKWLWGAINKVKDVWDSLNKMSNGHLLERLVEIRLAWGAITLAIGVAKAAQTAFGLISAAAGAGSAAAGAGAAGAAGAGAAGFGLLGPAAAVAAPLAVLGSVYYGASQYAKNPTAANMNPNNALLTSPAQKAMTANPAGAYMAGMMTPALAEALNKQQQPQQTAQSNQKVDVNVLLKWLGDNKGVHASAAPPITGASGPQYAAGGAH